MSLKQKAAGAESCVFSTIYCLKLCPKIKRKCEGVPERQPVRTTNRASSADITEKLVLPRFWPLGFDESLLRAALLGDGGATPQRLAPGRSSASTCLVGFLAGEDEEETGPQRGRCAPPGSGAVPWLSWGQLGM